MNYFLDAMRKYADFNGRARRSEYWYFALFYGLISVAVTILEFSMGMSVEQGGNGMLGLLLSLGFMIPSLAVAVRRMHDVGKSGWFCLIPLYNLYLAVQEGEYGSNEYGADPKNPDAGDDIIDHLVE